MRHRLAILSAIAVVCLAMHGCGDDKPTVDVKAAPDKTEAKSTDAKPADAAPAKPADASATPATTPAPAPAPAK
jgi:hypothetical protein